MAAGGLMWLVRVGLPAAMVLVGAVLLLVGGDSGQGAGAALIGSAFLVVIANLLMRLGVLDQREREDEEARREYFRTHGRWPDE